MKLNISFSKLFNNNRFVLVLSILIAIIAWFSVSMTVAPNANRSIENIPINLDLTGTTPESQKLTILDTTEAMASVRVEGPRNKIGLLAPEDFVATPVWTGVTEAGLQNVPITVRLRDETDKDIVIKGYTSSIKLNFDRLETKVFELEPDVADISTAADFKTDVENISVSPSSLSITGPQTELDNISRCAVQYRGDPNVLLEELTTVTGELVFYNEKGNIVSEAQLPHIEYIKQDFTVTIPVVMVKSVPVEVTFINSESLDTNKLTYFLDHETITIAGPKSVIEKREKISLDPIDVSKLDGRVFSLPIQLNAGETNVENVQNVIVSFDQENWDQTTLTIPQKNIKLMNEPAGYAVTITSESIPEVIMYGFKDDISKLSAKDLIARADVIDVNETTLRVRVDIWVTGNKNVWAVGEYYAYIEAVKKE